MAFETTVFGMNGTGQWSDPDYRPLSYREEAFKLFPDEPTPFTYILSMLPTKVETDAEFKIFEDRLPDQVAVIKAVDAATVLAKHDTVAITFYTSSDDATLYPDNPSYNFKVGDLLRVQKAAGSQTGEFLRVTVITDNDQITCTRHWGYQSGDDDVPGTATLAASDIVRWGGSADPEGNSAPVAISKRPTVVTNYTEIFKDSAALTGTAEATTFRPVKDAFMDLKKQALLRHMMKLEWAFLLGRAEETTVTNAYGDTTYVRSTGGFRPFVERAGYLTDFSGAVAIEDVEDGLRDAFMYGSKEKLAVCGYQALNIVNRLVRTETVWHWDGGSNGMMDKKQTYGLSVFSLRSPFGVLKLVPHPLLAESTLHTNEMYIMDTKYLEYVTLKGRDTKWHDNAQDNDEDSRRGYWQTEAGLRLAMPECHAVWTGFSALA